MLAQIVVLSMAVASDSYYPNHIRWGYDNRHQAQAMVLASDLVIGCLFAGLSSCDGFIEACGKGAIGGAVSFSGKVLATKAVKDGKPTFNPLAGKIVNDAGVSIVRNVMADKPMFSTLHVNIGFVSLAIGRDAGLRVSLASAIGVASNVVSKNKINWQYTLKYGTPVFTLKHVAYGGYIADGITSANVIGVSKHGYNNPVLSHELMHTMQYTKFGLFNEAYRNAVSPEVFKLTDWYDIAQDSAYALFHAPLLYHDAYFNMPTEIEAYYMEGN